MTSTTAVPRHQTVRSVVKATHVLLRIADSDGLTAAQTAAAVELPLQTVYNLLNTLLAEGMLSRDGSRRYRLGPKIASLCAGYARIAPSEDLLQTLRDLAEATGETTYVSGWQTGQVVALATMEGSSAVRVGRIHAEMRGAEHARASGKLMLAFLAPEALDAYLASHRLKRLTTRTIVDEDELRSELVAIRKRGWASDEGEFFDGVGCVAAPIMDDGTQRGLYWSLRAIGPVPQQSRAAH